jgi:hypothetical protein
MTELDGLGEMLVGFAVAEQSAVELSVELRSIHDEFIRNRDAEKGYFRMGFLAAKAVERCRQLEGSDGGVRAGDRAGGRRDSEGDGEAASAQADRGPAGPPR